MTIPKGVTHVDCDNEYWQVKGNMAREIPASGGKGRWICVEEASKRFGPFVNVLDRYKDQFEP